MNIYIPGLLIFLGSFHVVESCWGSSYPQYPIGDLPGMTKKTKKPRVKDFWKTTEAKNLQNAFGGFPISNETLEKFKNWLEEYLQERLKEKNAPPGEARGDYPDAWQGIGPGFSGFPPHDPPPWAYRPKNIGMPSYCYEPPNSNDCRTYENVPGGEKRWAYNPYLDQCYQFHYDGCVKIKNNFRSEAKCEEKCMFTEPKGCDELTDIPLPDGGIVFDKDRRSARKCGFPTA